MRVVVLVIATLVFSTPIFAQEHYKIYSVEAPPLSMQHPETDYGRGIVLDAVLEAFRRLDISARVEFIPWKRAQREVSMGRDAFILPLARIPEREQRFTWVAPVMDLERSFASLRSRVDSYKQARAELRSIGVGFGTAQYHLLLANGFSEQQLVEILPGKGPSMLALGRIDAWFNGTDETLWYWKRDQQIEPLLVGDAVASNQLYLAASLDVDEALLESLNRKIVELQREGYIEMLKTRYLGGEVASPE
ncbi:substrate-binding periplasmic protein [Aliagarivorans taiwanensis]|uniref:substrate-binding periplasmic protein n=1 Tax=Aliagarivorans taiwanensis TaxID=561966 RepID=UPI00068572D4|nr:ABC transporter substrate-binding protein [Aliagarivorans taiwanensis]